MAGTLGGCKALTISGFAKVMMMGFAYMAQNLLLNASSSPAQVLQTAGREVNKINIGKISDNSIWCREKLPGLNAGRKRECDCGCVTASWEMAAH